MAKKKRQSGGKRRSKKAEKRREHPRGVRPFWSGTISFGLVSVPVNLYPATRRQSASLRLLAEDGTPLARRYSCPQHERDVHPEHIVRGYPVAEDEYVIVRDDELESVAPRKSRDIDLRRFVEREQVPPILFERAYFLTPAGDSTKAYRLLAEVMEESERAGIATFVMRNKEYLIAILAENGILRAETLRFEDEVRTPEDVGLPDVQQPADKRAKQFARTIEKLSAKELSADALEDEQHRRLLELVEAKRRRGKDVVEADEDEAERDAEEREADEAPEVDLLETIRRSLRGGNGAKPNGKQPKTKRSGSSRQASKGRLGERSKERLYEEAQRLDIPGRSKMTKKELEAAIRKSV